MKTRLLDAAIYRSRQIVRALSHSDMQDDCLVLALIHQKVSLKYLEAADVTTEGLAHALDRVRGRVGQ